MWQMPPEVVKCGLDAVAKNRAVAIPGAVNKVLGNLTAITPDAVTRRVSGIVMKRASH
jgi:short-subunit dehydrogenase